MKKRLRLIFLLWGVHTASLAMYSVSSAKDSIISTDLFFLWNSK